VVRAENGRMVWQKVGQAEAARATAGTGVPATAEWKSCCPPRGKRCRANGGLFCSYARASNRSMSTVNHTWSGMVQGRGIRQPMHNDRHTNLSARRCSCSALSDAACNKRRVRVECAARSAVKRCAAQCAQTRPPTGAFFFFFFVEGR